MWEGTGTRIFRAKFSGRWKERGSGLSCWCLGTEQPELRTKAQSRAGDAGRGRGRGGRGGREEEGVRGRNLPRLSASLSALGLGTKGGTLMNSFSRSLDARLSLSRNFVNATFSAVRLRKSVPAPRRLQQWKQCLFKVRRSGGKKVSGLSCLPCSPQVALLLALPRAKS